MAAKNDSYEFSTPLALRTPVGTQLIVQAHKLALNQVDETIVKCELTFKVNYESYKQIDQQALFNLQPELRGPIYNGNFEPNSDIEIEARLQPEFLSCLNKHATSTEEALAYLLELSQQPDSFDPLLSTEHWYGLYVKQEMALPPELANEGTLKVGYRTQWVEILETNEANDTMLETAIEFFTKNNWTFQREGQSLLSSVYEGDNGTWTCYTHIREEEKFFLFYSICPFLALPQHLPVVTEFLTRANYDLPIGNFEINLDTGEVRFKTSIDVEGTELNVALVQQLIQSNLLMMDRYLPGVKAIIKNGLSSMDALTQVENA